MGVLGRKMKTLGARSANPNIVQQQTPYLAALQRVTRLEDPAPDTATVRRRVGPVMQVPVGTLARLFFTSPHLSRCCYHSSPTNPSTNTPPSWLYLVTFNGLWVAFPIWILWEGYRAMGSAMSQAEMVDLVKYLNKKA